MSPTHIDSGPSTASTDTFSMFIGEFLCVIPLIWTFLSSPTKGRPSYLSRLLARDDGAYAPIDGEDADAESIASTVETDQIRMRGWAVFWMWFPAFFDSE